ncbi:TRAP-type C4-dicarboxylate transport system permease small subunit [Hoeflea marina]|uniref:TRAP transporter small permease protein n=1 Tax=Hoeflea marina TaxID=274592 RepID=A0A317PKH5_9HYPH|nr:TRAP transporter small permease subunit [Hoeflea marina]PWW00288.1 TRAP-type C4-dicarboxylate transport system permease small subunit [Hoeflea marina]
MTRQWNSRGRAVMARLAEAGLSAGIGLLALMAVLIVLQVVARNIFDLGLPWADELARFCGIGLVFLTVPALVLRHQMVAVTLLPDSLNAPARRGIHVVAELSTIGFAGLTLWGFAAFLPRAGKFLTPAMGMPNWGYYAPALVGTILLVLAAVFRILDILHAPDEADKGMIL